MTSGLLCVQSAWSAAFAGFVAWRLGLLMRGEVESKRVEQLERALRARGVEVELLRPARELLGMSDVDPRVLVQDETIFRESGLRWVEALLRSGEDPRPAIDELERLRRRLGFASAKPPEGLPADGRLLLTFEAQNEVLEACVVVPGQPAIDVVSARLEQLDARALREVSALFAVGEEIATCECRVVEVQELAGDALWWRIELPRGPLQAARRQQHRVPLRLAGRVIVARGESSRVDAAEPLAEETITAAFLLDMSMGGVKLRVASDVTPGDRVWLSVGRSDRRADELEMAGRVVWTLREDGFATATAGVEFDRFDASTRSRVARFLARRSFSAGTSSPEDRSC
ncbi:MAG: PilZ domain-containing protein [Planctomycetes bacterium]|nr:PilZ domain-containing protein [Planctomycetota bacterium]